MQTIFQIQRLSDSVQKGLERSTHLIFWCASDDLRAFDCYGVGEGL